MVELINREYVEGIYEKIMAWKNNGQIRSIALFRDIIDIPKLVGNRQFECFLCGLNYLVLKKNPKEFDRDYNLQMERREQLSKKKNLDKICIGVDLDNKKEVKKLFENSGLDSSYIKKIYEMLDLLDKVIPDKI